MSETTIPRFDRLMQAVMDALHAGHGQASNGAINAHVVQTLALPSASAEQVHQVGAPLTELEYRLQWSRTYLRRCGLIDSPRRGYWILTELGWKTDAVDSAEIIRVVRRQMQARAITQEGQASIFAETANVTAPKVRVTTGTPDLRSPTPLFPTYANVRHFLRTLDGSGAAAYLSMAGAILDQRGNPQERVDWSDPDEWIAARLQGANRALAERLWHDSQRQLNPRYTRGCWYLTARHDLLAHDRGDILRVTERGRLFLAEQIGPLIAEIDAYEGVLTVLRLVAEQGVARRGALLPGYSEYSRTYTTFQSDNVLKSSLHDRLCNLIERELVNVHEHSYAATEAGLHYLERYAAFAPEQARPTGKGSELFRIARAIGDDVRTSLRAYLLDMDASKFAELIKFLLGQMGYDDIASTSPTNDKEVDVVGTIELGISTVRDMIIVSRQRGAVTRPVLDQLRGSLQRSNAVRGTIITTGRFSAGVKEAAFERGAAPITLIDGDKLVYLLVEHEIGVTRRQVDYLEFAPEKLTHFQIAGES